MRHKIAIKEGDENRRRIDSLKTRARLRENNPDSRYRAIRWASANRVSSVSVDGFMCIFRTVRETRESRHCQKYKILAEKWTFRKSQKLLSLGKEYTQLCNVWKMSGNDWSFFVYDRQNDTKASSYYRGRVSLNPFEQTELFVIDIRSYKRRPYNLSVQNCKERFYVDCINIITCRWRRRFRRKRKMVQSKGATYCVDNYQMCWRWTRI